MEPSTESPQCYGQEDNPIKQPPCATWNVWTGFEIEGTEDLGEHTLFVRSFTEEHQGTQKVISAHDVYTRAIERGIKRIWFCEEFTNIVLIADACSRFEKVCVCLTLESLHALGRALTHHLNADTAETIRYYLKFGPHCPLRAGDFVCVGKKYADTAFQLQSAGDVTTELYEEDVRWY